MAWPTDDLTTTHLDSETDLVAAARTEIIAAVNKIKAILAEVPAGKKVWHEDNDGAGSGLDADRLDGVELYRGRVNSDGSTISLPSGWSVAKIETGVYEITHNLGMSAYTVSVSLYGGTGNLIHNLGTTNPLLSFRVYVKTAAGTAADSLFHFFLMRDY